MMGNITVAMIMRMATVTVPADLSGERYQDVGAAEGTVVIKG